MTTFKFKLSSIPEPSVGKSFEGEETVTVPNQALSLEEILERFTRGEKLAVQKETFYTDEDISPELDVDLEKLRHEDLVDKADAIVTMENVQKQYEQQEKNRQLAEKKLKEAAEKAKNNPDNVSGKDKAAQNT